MIDGKVYHVCAKDPQNNLIGVKEIQLQSTPEDVEYVEDIIKGKIDQELNKDQIEELKDMKEWESGEDLFEFIKENIDDNCYLVYEMKQSFIVPGPIFLTKEEAKEHIELNDYHYTDEVHTYAMTAWRAPKVERLLNILETFDWESISTK
ncbi:hypothetical protein E1A90_09800 [Bacillus mycoides]|nr:hypothetical protein E1A90_09800 [Bacillus mycoides]